MPTLRQEMAPKLKELSKQADMWSYNYVMSGGNPSYMLAYESVKERIIAIKEDILKSEGRL